MRLPTTDVSYFSPSTPEIVFGLLGIVVLVGAVLVVTTRQIVHAALWLVVTLLALAGCFLVLSAEFLAWVQVLIYVGAVVVLLLFGLMLTRAPIGVSDDLNSSGPQRIAAVLAALATAGVLVTAVIDAFRHAWIDVSGLNSARPGSGSAIGSAVFKYWVLPFELLSVLLLAALIGAIVVSRSREGDPADVASEDASTHPARVG